MAGFGELVSTLDDLMGDFNAVKKGNVSQRGGRRAVGKAASQGSGETVTEIAARFGVSRGWIHKWVYPTLDPVKQQWAADI